MLYINTEVQHRSWHRLLSHGHPTLSTRDPLLILLSQQRLVSTQEDLLRYGYTWLYQHWDMELCGLDSAGENRGLWAVLLNPGSSQWGLFLIKKLGDVYESELSLVQNLINVFFFFSSVFNFTVSYSVAWRCDDTFYISSFLKVLKASSGLRRTDRRISVSVLPVGWLCIPRTLCPAPRKYFSDACSQR